MSEPAFVPFHSAPRNGKGSARVGWVVAEESGCHIWQGARDRGGYGLVGVNKRTRLVHRVRYEAEVGVIPAGMDLDHFMCNNPSCCNPLHVRPVTTRENVLRGNTIVAKHAAKTHCPRGHELEGANLSKYDLSVGRRRCLACRKIRSAIKTNRSV